MDPTAFEDRHAVLNPEQGLLAVDLREKESGPAAITWVCREQLGKCGTGRCGHTPALAQSLGETIISRFGARDSSAGDQRQISCHTTHNIRVLLLFFVSQLMGKSQWRDSPFILRPIGGRPSTEARKASTSSTTWLNAGRHSAIPIWCVSTAIDLSTS